MINQFWPAKSVKKCLYGTAPDCSYGYADILWQSDSGVYLVWEVKAESQAKKAQVEAQWYAAKLRGLGLNAGLGWAVGGPYYDTDGKYVRGPEQGAVIYGQTRGPRDPTRLPGNPGDALRNALLLSLAAGLGGGLAAGSGGGAAGGGRGQPGGVPVPGGQPVPVPMGSSLLGWPTQPPWSTAGLGAPVSPIINP